jgi:NTP pyrophosphatase (non-canonical NTP hydrolase)
MTLTLEEFEDFIEEQDILLQGIHSKGQSARERIYARTVKLGEEYGELCDAILGSFGEQRTDKQDRENLEGEFADVVIVAYMLARSMQVDMQQALRQKIKKIRTKHNKVLGKGVES